MFQSLNFFVRGQVIVALILLLGTSTHATARSASDFETQIRMENCDCLQVKPDGDAVFLSSLLPSRDAADLNIYKEGNNQKKIEAELDRMCVEVSRSFASESSKTKDFDIVHSGCQISSRTAAGDWKIR